MIEIKCSYKKLVPIQDLKPHPRNRNKHPKEQIDRLAKIVKYQGIRSPIKVSNLSGYITAGHGRLDVFKKLKLKEVPVDFQDYENEEQEYADIQADNAIASWAELDLSGINADVPELGPDFDIDLLGIKDFALEPAEKFAPGCDDDEVPEIKESFVKPGDIWQLGRHRLMCGDSTSIDAVEKLMAGEKADLWLTDPPYGVSYADKNEFLNSLGKPNSITKRIENDHKSLDEMKVFWTNCAASAFAVCSEKSAYYWFACQGGDQMMMMMMSLGDGGWQVKHELVWVKNNHVLGRTDYSYKHEPIIYGWKRGGTHEYFGGFQTSVLEFDRPQSSKLHPTMKPIELLERLIENSTKSQYKVLDLFGGSGSTLIACEKTNRTCFMMELDPHYVSVIIERWQKYTGNKAELINGKT